MGAQVSLHFAVDAPRPETGAGIYSKGDAGSA